MDIFTTVNTFVKKHKSIIMTIAAGIGVAATSISCAKQTLKIDDILKSEEHERVTKSKKAWQITKTYLPTVILGTATILCIVELNSINKKQKTAFISAYSLLNNAYHSYILGSKEVFGDDAETKIRESIAKKNNTISPIKTQSLNTELFYDSFSNRYFESTTKDIMSAEYSLNRRLNLEGDVTLNDFYELIGIPKIDCGEYLGWNLQEMLETYMHPWVEFQHDVCTMDDGLECTIISMPIDPMCEPESFYS